MITELLAAVAVVLICGLLFKFNRKDKYDNLPPGMERFTFINFIFYFILSSMKY